MIPLDYLSVARFSGPESAAFLQSQLSADIDALVPGKAGFACYCTPKGQVIGLLLVCRLEDDFLVAGAAELLPAMLQRLKMYVLRTRVNFERDEGLTVMGLEPSEQLAADGFFQAGNLDLHYGFTSDATEMAPSKETFRAREISNGVAWLGATTSEKFIPQMLGYESIGALSFSKGCYPGQEIVARTRYLGKVKRKPAIVATVDPLAVKPASRIELRRGEAWLKGVVIDSADWQGGTIVFIVAPLEPESATDELRFGDNLYRCATT